jgi:hypothetical protein
MSASALSTLLCRASAPQPSPCCSRRASLLGVSALLVLPAPALALAPESKTLVGRSGLRAELPSAWVVASDRADSRDKAGTLLFTGDFAAVDTLSVRRELAPAELASAGDAGAARLLSADESGLVTILAASRTAGRELVVESTQRLCRGTETEGKGGAERCEGPRGDELPFVLRHSFARFVPAGNGTVIAIRGSCLEERWDMKGETLREVVRAVDLAGLSQ